MATDEMTNSADKLPLTGNIRAGIITTLVASALGYLDYLTGNISVDGLYFICVVAVTWLSGSVVGALCVLEVIFAKWLADSHTSFEVSSLVNTWNSLSSVGFNLTAWFLTNELKKSKSK